MKIPLSAILSLYILGLFLCLPAYADDINVVADPYMPYTGDPNSNKPGFMVEILKAVFEKAGHTITYKQYAWDEAVGLAKNGDATILLGANKEDVPDFIFPDTEQAVAQGVFYTSNTTGWKYKGPDSLKKICLGIINKYNYTEIQAHIKANRSNSKVILQFSDANALEKMIEAIADERIQAFVEDRYVMQEFLKTYSKPEKIVEAGPLGAATKLYAALSPKNASSEEYSKIISSGMKTIRENGTLAEIMKKYGLQPW